MLLSSLSYLGWSPLIFRLLGGSSRLLCFSLIKFLLQPLGDLGTLEADEKGEAIFTVMKQNLRVADLIGRSVVLYRTEDKSEVGIEAAVIARSAGVGENYKKLCTCDGTIIWESTSNDFVTAKF